MLRELRVKKGLTMKQLGEMVGVSEASISLYENGVHRPKMETAKKLATILGCSWPDVYDNQKGGQNDGAAS